MAFLDADGLNTYHQGVKQMVDGVLPTVTASDEGKALVVDENGAWTKGDVAGGGNEFVILRDGNFSRTVQTYGEIVAAYNEGKMLFYKESTTYTCMWMLCGYYTDSSTASINKGFYFTRIEEDKYNEGTSYSVSNSHQARIEYVRIYNRDPSAVASIYTLVYRAPVFAANSSLQRQTYVRTNSNGDGFELYDLEANELQNLRVNFALLDFNSGHSVIQCPYNNENPDARIGPSTTIPAYDTYIYRTTADVAYPFGSGFVEQFADLFARAIPLGGASIDVSILKIGLNYNTTIATASVPMSHSGEATNAYVDPNTCQIHDEWIDSTVCVDVPIHDNITFLYGHDGDPADSPTFDIKSIPIKFRVSIYAVWNQDGEYIEGCRYRIGFSVGQPIMRSGTPPTVSQFNENLAVCFTLHAGPAFYIGTRPLCETVWETPGEVEP